MQENDNKIEEDEYQKIKNNSDHETNLFNENTSKEKFEDSPIINSRNIKFIVKQIKKEDLLLKKFQPEPHPVFSNLKRSSTLDNWKTRKSSLNFDQENLFDLNENLNFQHKSSAPADEHLNRRRTNLKKSNIYCSSPNTNAINKKVSTWAKESNNNYNNNLTSEKNSADLSNKNYFFTNNSKRKGYSVYNNNTSIIKLDKYFQFIKRENKEKRKKQYTKKRLEIIIKFAFYVLSNIINILAVFNYILQTFFNDSPENAEINLFLTYIELALTFYFLFEYIFICYKIKGSYFKHFLSIDSFIDMITIIPSIITYFISFRGVKLSFIRVFRIFRVFRILRIYKSLRMIQVESYNSQDEEGTKSNSKLIKFDPIKLQFITIVVILICVFFIGAGLVLGVNDLVEDAFTLKAFNFLDATYFMIVTYCTLGYGDILPTTISTRFMIIIGLFCLFVIVSDQLTRLGNLLKFWGPGLIQYNGKNHIIIIADKTINLKLFLEILSRNADEKIEFIIISKDIQELPNNRFPFKKAQLVKKEDIDLDLLDLINLKQASAVFIFSTKSNFYYERYDKITDFFFMKITQNYLNTPPIYLQTLNSDKSVPYSNRANQLNVFSKSKTKVFKENTLKNLKRAIPIWKIKSLILSKCTFNPGFATFIQNLLFNDYQCPPDIDDQSEVLQNYMRGCENGICLHKLPSFFTGKNFYDVMYIIYFKSINDYFVKVNLEETETNRPILLIGIYEKNKLSLSGTNNIEIFPNDYLISEGSYGVFISYNDNDYIENHLNFFNEEYGNKINKKLDVYNNANNSFVSSGCGVNSQDFGNLSDNGIGTQEKNLSSNNNNNNNYNTNKSKDKNDIDDCKEKELFSFKSFSEKPNEIQSFSYHRRLSEQNKRKSLINKNNKNEQNDDENDNENINISKIKNSFLNKQSSRASKHRLNSLSGEFESNSSSFSKQNFMEDNKDYMEDNKSNKKNSANFNNIYYKFAQGVLNRFSSSLKRNNSLNRFSENNPIEEVIENSRDETNHDNLKIEELTEHESSRYSENKNEKENVNESRKIKNQKEQKQEEDDYDDIEIYNEEEIKIKKPLGEFKAKFNFNSNSINKLKRKKSKFSDGNVSKSSKNVKVITNKKISFDLNENENFNNDNNYSLAPKLFSEKNVFTVDAEENKNNKKFYKRMFKNMRKSNQAKEEIEEHENNKSKSNKSTELADDYPILTGLRKPKNNDLIINQNLKKIGTLDLDLKKNGITTENFSEIFIKKNSCEDKNLTIPDDLGFINSIKSINNNNNNNNDLIKIESYNHFFLNEKESQNFDTNNNNNNCNNEQQTVSNFSSLINKENQENNIEKGKKKYLVLNENITDFSKNQAIATGEAIKSELNTRLKIRSRTYSEFLDENLVQKLFSKIDEPQLDFYGESNGSEDFKHAAKIHPKNRNSQQAFIKKNFKLSIIEKPEDKKLNYNGKKQSIKYSGFVEQLAKVADQMKLDQSNDKKTAKKKSLAKPYNYSKNKNNNLNNNNNNNFSSINKNRNSILNSTVRSNTGFLNLFELGFVHEDNFKNKNTIKNLEFLNEGDNTLKDIVLSQGITNEKINLKANKLYTDLSEKENNKFKTYLNKKSKKPENTKLIEFNIFDIEKDDLSKRFRNHIIIIGYQDILSKLLKLIFMHQEKDICIIGTPDSDEVFIHKLLKQYDNLFYFKGSPENPFHLLNAGLNNAYMVFFLTENLFGKTNEDMQKILIYKSIDYFFNTRMVLELWSSQSCRLLGNVPLLSNGEIEPNEFLNPAFMAGRLIYVSHLENVTAKAYTEEANTEVWLKLINLGLVTRYEKGHRTICNGNSNLSAEGMPIILTLEIPAFYNDREYYNLVDDLMKLNPPALPVGIFIESPLDYLRLRSRGNIKRDKTDLGLSSQVNITTSHKKKLVNLYKLDKIDKTYLGNLKVLRDISYNDKVFLDIVDLNNSYMPMFITNPHPGFIISSKCKVMVIYYNVTNKAKDKLKNFKLKRTIGIKNTTKNEFKKEASIGDEFRQKQEMLKNKQEKIFGYYEMLKRKLVDNIEKKYAHIIKEVKMKNINNTEQSDNNMFLN